MNDLFRIIDENNLWEDELSLKRNHFLIKEKNINQNIYFIKEGSVKVFTTINNEEQIIRLGYKNSFITALDSFLNQHPTKYNVQTIKSSVIKVISKEKLLHFIQNNHLQSFWIELLSQLILQQNEREIDLLTNSAKERFERLLQRSPNLFQEVPNKYIANYLRISAETLSRLTRKS